MSEIALTRGQVAIVDEADLQELSRHKWHAKKPSNAPSKWYAQTNIWNGERWRLVAMHRFLMEPPRGLSVDHINGNGLDNRRSNLRICTHSQNLQNRNAYGISKYLGVALKGGKTNPWSAQIDSEYLGRFATEEEAAAAYDVAAKAKHGEFAKLNFSDADRPTFRRAPAWKKLTREQVEQIRAIGRSETTVALGRRFGVSHRLISMILLRQAHVD